MRENLIEQYLRRQAKKLNLLVYKWVSPGVKGVPDDIVVGDEICPCCQRAPVDFVELKTETGKLSKLQVHQLNRLSNQGARCYVIQGKEGTDLYLAGELEPWS